jgi:hypothetical protein
MDGLTNAHDEVHDGSTIVQRDELSLVIAEWEQLSREEPWHVDPHRYGIDALHETMRAVLDIATWGGTDTFAPERLVRTAVAHGEQRRAQGASDDAVLREYHALRAALWRFLQRSVPQGPAAIGAILRVDVAIGVATIVALRGFHRGELASGTSWEADILKQVDAVSRHLVDHLHEGPRS